MLYSKCLCSLILEIFSPNPTVLRGVNDFCLYKRVLRDTLYSLYHARRQKEGTISKPDIITSPDIESALIPEL